MGVIPGELLKIKNLKGKTGSMRSTSSTIQGKISSLMSATSTAKSGIDSNYDSSNKSSLLSSFESLNSALGKINSSLSGDLDSILSLVDSLISEIEELEDINAKIEEQENKINSAMSNIDDENSISTIMTARGEISKLEADFTKLLDTAMADYTELMSKNPTIDIGTVSASGSFGSIGKVSSQLQNLEEGTYNKVLYKGENGRTVKAYIYLPKGTSTTEGLPVTLYMGTDGAKGHALQDGVGYELRKGAQYSGIVIVLEPEDDKSFSDSSYLDTSKEIADNIIKTYTADENRVSISGCSYGGSGVQHMVERYPGYFSQAVILGQGTGAIGRESGGNKEEAIEKLKQTKFHIICGTKDSSIYSLQRLYEELNNGGYATYEWRNGVDHDHINSFDPIVVDGVEYPNYVEFCLAQSRETTKA